MTKTLSAYYQNCVLLYTPIWGVSNKPPSPLLGHWNNNSIPSHIKFIQFSMSWVFLDFFYIRHEWALETMSHIYKLLNNTLLCCIVTFQRMNDKYFVTQIKGEIMHVIFYLWIINSTSLSNNRLKTYITDFSGILQINKQMSSAYSINLYKKYTEIVISIQYNTDWT